MDKIDAIAASDLVSGAVLAALIAQLQAKGILSGDEVRSVYEHALVLLDEARGNSEIPDIYDAAREMLEEQLRG